MEWALVDGAISEKAQTAATNSLVFEGESNSQAERSLSADNAMPAPIIFVRRKEMHRSPLPFGTTSGFAEEFGHARLHVHADSQRMSVIAVCRDDVVVFPQQGHRPNGDGFLARVQMEETSHPS
jgi:hypothetical protein